MGVPASLVEHAVSAKEAAPQTMHNSRGKPLLTTRLSGYGNIIYNRPFRYILGGEDIYSESFRNERNRPFRFETFRRKDSRSAAINPPTVQACSPTHCRVKQNGLNLRDRNQRCLAGRPVRAATSQAFPKAPE
jgi:hypothetical protein